MPGVTGVVGVRSLVKGWQGLGTNNSKTTCIFRDSDVWGNRSSGGEESSQGMGRFRNQQQ